MGLICGPSIANLFVFIYEKSCLNIHKPLINYRFIDDLFMVFIDFSYIESLKSSFGSFSLTVEINKII